MQRLTGLLTRLGPPRKVLLIAVVLIALALLAWGVARRMREPFAELGASLGAPLLTAAAAGGSSGDDDGGDDDDDDKKTRAPETPEERAARKAKERARRLPLGDCPLRKQGYSHWSYGADPTVPGSGVCCRYKDNVGCKTEWWNDGGEMKLRVKPGAPVFTKAPRPTPTPTPTPAPTAAPTEAPVATLAPAPKPPAPLSKFGGNPNAIHESALKEMGVDVEQMTNILGMINGPEQSNIHFWQRVDKKSVFGYCENINDNRGITVGIAGFVSKYGFPQRMIKDYGGPNFDVNKCRPGNPTRCDACDWIRSKGDDQKWQDIQWRVYANEYMRPAMKYIPARFKDNALIKGLALDTMMNAGEFKEPRMWGLKEISNAAKNETDPLRYVMSFLKARGDNFTTGNSDKMRQGRLGSWEKLAKAGKWDMRDINLCSAAYCSGRCVNC